MKKITILLLTFMLCFTNLSGSIPPDIYAQQAEQKQDVQKETVFNGNGFTVKYVIDSIWENQYTANVTITNTGSSTIENWELSYQSADEYSNIWNAEVTYHSARNYNVKNAGHNQNIAPGQSVSFGFQASFTGTPDIPVSYQMLGESQPVDGSDCQVTCNIQNQWNNGCIMEVTLYNRSDENIEDWSVQFDLPDRIDNIWRAEIASASEHTYRLKNCGYNAVIQPGMSETFGMQLSFPDGSTMHEPQNISVTQYKKGKWYVDFDKEWNRIMTHADSGTVTEAAKKNQYAVNVAVIDSGVDYSASMNIVKRETFVDGYDDSNPLFDDLSGHGTAVAGLLCSNSAVKEDSYQFEDKYLQKIMNEKIDGTSPYINVYSAKVLDSDNKTTVNRLIKAIDWAVENNVNIINISCGVNSDSARLHSAVKKAYDKGILLVAAAGNGGNIQYPAKYEEVMAVGAVTCSGTSAKSGSTGKELEVVAPGQDVTSYGPFGMLTSFSGSSMAAPQVTALAAVLWQQDLSKNSDFIRKLIDVTARSLGKKEKYGYGLIDCEYALQNYHEFEQQYHAPEAAVEEYEIDSNMDALLCLDEETVEGYWSGNMHKGMLDKEKLKFVKYGTGWPDQPVSKVNGHANPEFHGYSNYNYVKSYLFISKVAEHMYHNGKWPSEKDCSKKEKELLKKLKAATENNGFTKYHCTQKTQKGLFLYGLALHTVADIFAHSTKGYVSDESRDDESRRNETEEMSLKNICAKWKRLSHSTGDADNTECLNIRWKTAQNVCKKIIEKSVNKHKTGTKDVFKEIKHYKKCTTAKKYKTDGKKKKYVVESYGVINLSKYLKPGKSKKLKEVVENASNEKIENVIQQYEEKLKGGKTDSSAVTNSSGDDLMNINSLSAKVKPLSGQDKNGNTWTYDRKTKTLTFSGTTDLEEFELDGYNPEPEWWCWRFETEHLVIEPGITGLPGEEFQLFNKLKTVELPDTVTYIGDGVFMNCMELETVRMSTNLTFIGALAFDGCYKWKNAWIPENVTTIGWNAFSSCYCIKEIEIPEKVTKIGTYAFTGCENLEYVKLPSHLKVIEEGVFSGCKKLSEVTIPESVKKIETGAFMDSGIVSVEIPENVAGFYEGDGLFKDYYGVFEDCKKLKEVVIYSRKLKSCYKKTFKGMDKNTVIKVPKGCLKKYKKMFQKAGLDKSVRLEVIDGKEKKLSGQDRNRNTWTYDRETKTLVFSGTADLEKYTQEKEPGWCVWYSEAEHVVVHDGITGLPGGNFRLFYRLVTAELPESVESVGDYAFYGCKNLETITIPKNTAYIGKMAFADCYRLKEAVLPEGITSIGKRAFSGCEELGGMKLPDSVEKIGPYAFSECQSLASVRLPGKLKTVEEGVFSRCESLVGIKLPDSLKKIKKNAFSESGIIRIVIPKNVTGFYQDKKIRRKDGVFECCQGLKEIIIKSKKLEHVYEGAFVGLDSNPVIKVPKSCLKKYKKMFKKAGLDKKVKVKAEKPLAGQDENGNTWTYDRATKTMTFSGTKDLEYFELGCIAPEPEWFCWREEAEHLVIEPGITGLPGEEFSDFCKLKTADLPDTVTRIGNGVFCGCRELETVRMPENLTSIGALAFDGCASLKSIWIPEHVRTIGWCAFSGCDSIKEIEIPEKVTKIGSCAFGLCDNLESIRLPDNLKTVEASLFYDCRKLSEIRLPGSAKRIEREAFGCSGITHIEIPENVTGFYKGEDSYGSPGIFQDCKKLKEITIRSEKLGHVFKGAFDRMDKNTVIRVPESCLKRYKKLFKKAGLDKSVRVEAIDETDRPLSGKDRNGNTWTYERETKTLAFAGTADLEKYTPEREPGWSVWYREAEHVVVHDGITGLPGGNFRLFYRLVTAELPESVESVGDYAFYGCKNLETITIPKNTAYIGKMAFADCYRLKEVWMSEGITSIGKRAFSGCEELGGIKLPDSVEKIGPYAFSECHSLASVRLPGKLKTVEEGVFFQCRDLAEVNLPDSLKKIKKKAFSESGISRIVIPKNVTGFYEDKKSDCRDGVFECYPSLKEITIKSKKMEHVYEGAFLGLDKNTVIKVPKSCLKKYKKMFRKAGLNKKIKVKAISGKKKFSPVAFPENKYKADRNGPPCTYTKHLHKSC